MSLLLKATLHQKVVQESHNQLAERSGRRRWMLKRMEWKVSKKKKKLFTFQLFVDEWESLPSEPRIILRRSPWGGKTCSFLYHILSLFSILSTSNLWPLHVLESRIDLILSSIIRFGTKDTQWEHVRHWSDIVRTPQLKRTRCTFSVKESLQKFHEG